MTVDDDVKKYGEYSLYNNNGLLFCKCCHKKLDYVALNALMSSSLVFLRAPFFP